MVMRQNKNLDDDADGLGWRICYECVSPATGSRLRVLNEAEAYFWHLLGYEIRRLLEAAP
jgi:hypothetical protein